MQEHFDRREVSITTPCNSVLRGMGALKNEEQGEEIENGIESQSARLLF